MASDPGITYIWRLAGVVPLSGATKSQLPPPGGMVNVALKLSGSPVLVSAMSRVELPAPWGRLKLTAPVLTFSSAVALTVSVTLMVTGEAPPDIGVSVIVPV
jgi:hypothetical protein